MGFTLQIHISLFSNSLRCPHPSWAFLFTWTISLSLDYVYIITGFQFFVKGLKESFLNITKNITLEGIEPSLFYSNTTKPPGVERFSTKGIEPFLCTLSKLTLQKLSLILYCNYSITGIQPYVNGVIKVYSSIFISVSFMQQTAQLI